MIEDSNNGFWWWSMKLIIPTLNSKEFSDVVFLVFSVWVSLLEWGCWFAGRTFSRCIEWVGLFRDAKPPSSSRSSLYDTTSGPPRASLPTRHLRTVVLLCELRPPNICTPYYMTFSTFPDAKTTFFVTNICLLWLNFLAVLMICNTRNTRYYSSYNT